VLRNTNFQEYRAPLNHPQTKVEGTIATSLVRAGGGGTKQVVDLLSIPYRFVCTGRIAPSKLLKSLILFKNQEDCEFATATQPGLRCGGSLNNLWISHPAFPLPQYISYLEIQIPTESSDKGRATFAALRKYDEIGYMTWKKSPIDFRSEDQKELDRDEEAELDIPPR
jgi:hypothetical protein